MARSDRARGLPVKRACAPASALIIAGGRGTRFWPASREARPKPLFAPDGKTSLLAATILRLQPLIPRDRIFVLVAASHEKAFRLEISGKIPVPNLVVEPIGRNTAVAIAYGAALIRRSWHDVLQNHLRDGACSSCGRAIPGRWKIPAVPALSRASALAASKYEDLNL